MRAAAITLARALRALTLRVTDREHSAPADAAAAVGVALPLLLDKGAATPASPALLPVALSDCMAAATAAVFASQSDSRLCPASHAMMQTPLPKSTLVASSLSGLKGMCHDPHIVV